MWVTMARRGRRGDARRSAGWGTSSSGARPTAAAATAVVAIALASLARASRVGRRPHAHGQPPAPSTAHHSAWGR